MDLPKLTNDFVIDRLSVQPIGEHEWAQIQPGDPDQFNLYRRGPYTLLLRSHVLDVYAGPDAFEVILYEGAAVVFHEDVLEEDMNKDSILNAIRRFNAA